VVSRPLFDKNLEVEAQLAHGLLGLVVDAEVDKIVGAVGAGEKLGREVADDAHILGPVVQHGLDPSVHKAIADGMRKGHVEIVDRSPVARPALHKEEVVEEGMRQGVSASRCSLVFQRSLKTQFGQDRSGHGFTSRVGRGLRRPQKSGEPEQAEGPMGQE